MVGTLRKAGIGLIAILAGTFGNAQAQNSPAENYLFGETINNLGALGGHGSRQQKLDEFGRRSLNSFGDTLRFQAYLDANKEIAEAGRPQQNINVNVNTQPQQQYVQPQNQAVTYYSVPYSADIKDVDVFHNQTLANGENGMIISVTGNMYNLQNTPIQIISHFKFPNGELLRDIDNKYMTVDKKVCIYDDFTPTHKASETKTNLAIPYNQLHLAQGKHEVIGIVSVVKQKESEELLAREQFSFSVNMK